MGPPKAGYMMFPALVQVNKSGKLEAIISYFNKAKRGGPLEQLGMDVKGNKSNLKLLLCSSQFRSVPMHIHTKEYYCPNSLRGNVP